MQTEGVLCGEQNLELRKAPRGHPLQLFEYTKDYYGSQLQSTKVLTIVATTQ